MTKEQLVALRTMITLAEHHIRLSRRSKNRLEWTTLLRHARQAEREITNQAIDTAILQGKKWEQF